MNVEQDLDEIITLARLASCTQAAIRWCPGKNPDIVLAKCLEMLDQWKEEQQCIRREMSSASR